MNPLETIKSRLDEREREFLSPLASYSSNGIRRKHEERHEAGYRQTYSLDVDRILHSLAYTRYIDKTQVFYLIKNDHITHRVLHVQLVSKAARTIGRFLGLNEDLIEAIALAHDIGHAPFGHMGERFLSALCEEYGIGSFYHSVQSVRFLDRVERKGNGWNLCLQTLDGILCHDGEIHNRELQPERSKTFEQLDAEIIEKTSNPENNLVPMTMEGCVVRMTDTISYIGRDIEDAIRLGLITRSDLPDECVKFLGNTNGTIVYNLVTDIIQNSFQQTYVSFSPQMSDALKNLKHFNYEHIYHNPAITKHSDIIKSLFRQLFEQFLEDIETENHSSVIFTGYLKDMAKDYTENFKKEEIVRDFIAGMTDHYFLELSGSDLQPEQLFE